MSIQKKLWGVASQKGPRPTMEDAYFFFETPQGWIAGLFDGHVGGEGSAEAARLFALKLSSGQQHPPTREYLTDLFRQVNQELAGKIGGTTALVVIRHHDQLTCAVAGDSQCVMLALGGELVINEPHRLTHEIERDRVAQAGGTIVLLSGTYRVLRNDGTRGLMVTRALNNPQYAPGVIPDPEVIHFTNELSARFICLVCDGVWEFVSPEKMNTLAKRKRSPRVLAEWLVSVALTQGSMDNCTALVVRL
ncbi:MAG: protein serine/threonine phosphatase 2C family protein [Candidatus Kerfeldbacteria bacterium]|nr:protein serine/threonine phosphatase 2C family protein [Candidatus Kerfeldbacteria bacterium]